MVIVPLIASSVIVAIATMPRRGTLGQMGVRAFAYILVSLSIAIVIGSLIGHLLAPGASISDGARQALLSTDAPSVDTPPERPSLSDTLLNIVPESLPQTSVRLAELEGAK